MPTMPAGSEDLSTGKRLTKELCLLNESFNGFSESQQYRVQGKEDIEEE